MVCGRGREKGYGRVVRPHVAVDEEGGLLVQLVHVAVQHALQVEGVDGEGVQAREDVELVVDQQVDRRVEAGENGWREGTSARAPSR